MPTWFHEYLAAWDSQEVDTGVRGVSVGTRRQGKICANRDYWDGKKFDVGPPALVEGITAHELRS
jgi:hypothetical protein